MLQVLVDFNSLTMGEDGQVTINLDIAPNTHIVLHNGDRVLLCDDEFAVEGMTTWDANMHLWLARPDWTTRQEREVLVATTPVLRS
jgi:hypothetical protein